MTDGFFVPSHAALVAMFKLLGPGVVRIGADDVNTSVWVPGATSVKAGTTRTTSAPPRWTRWRISDRHRLEGDLRA